MTSKLETRFKCAVCGKITAGRIGRDGRHVGDGSGRYPRRHNVDGKPCPGNIQEAEWIDVKAVHRKSAADRFLDLLTSGGYAIQEAGWGSICFGSDGKTYSARTARSLERAGKIELAWINKRGSWNWTWLIAQQNESHPTINRMALRVSTKQRPVSRST